MIDVGEVYQAVVVERAIEGSIGILIILHV